MIRKMEERTLDSVLAWFKEAVTERQPISPHLWVEAAQQLNILQEDEDDKLCELEQKVAHAKWSYMENGYTNAKAEARVKIEPIYKELLFTKAKIKRIQEFIRIAKLQARLKDSELKNYN